MAYLGRQDKVSHSSSALQIKERAKQKADCLVGNVLKTVHIVAENCAVQELIRNTSCYQSALNNNLNSACSCLSQCYPHSIESAPQ